MAAEPHPLGILTTDDRLVVRAWDGWLADATGIPAERAVDRPLTEVVPDLESRGVLPTLHRVLTKGTVEVLAPALHQYFVPCPPRAAVDGFDRMRQHVTIGPLRDEGRTVGLIVTIEDVTARVAGERQLAARLREAPGGEPAGGASIEALTRLIAQDDWRVRRAAVAGLAAHGQAAVESLVRALRTQHRNLAVLSSALDLLATSEIDIVAPLVGFLQDEDVNLRIQAALILGERRDGRAIPALMAALDDPDPNVQFHAVEALGRLNASEAADALLAIAERRDFFLAFPAIHALSRVGHPAIAPRLVPLLADDLLRAPAIEALGELGDEDVTAPLVDLLNTSAAPPDVIAEALAGLHERYEQRYGAGEHIAAIVRRRIGPTGIQRILDAAQRVGPDRLPGLAKVLSWLEGEAVQRALTRLLGQETVRSQVVEALVRHGAGVVTLLLEQLRAEDLEVRQAAAVALGRIGDRRATPGLVAALADAELAIPAAGALARIGDRDAFEGLLALLRSSSAAVRQAAIAALNSIGHPDMSARIAALLGDENPAVREAALRIAGYFGYPECFERVLACCGDRSDAVRRAAVESLAFFDDPRVVPSLTRALKEDTPAVRAAAAAALARVDLPRTSPRSAETGHDGSDPLPPLLDALDDGDLWVRFAVVRALGSRGDRRVAERILDTLRRDPAPPVRLAAIEVLGRLAPPEALDVLEPLTRDPDRDIAGAAIRALSDIDRPEALQLLEGLLRAPDPWQRAAAVTGLTSRADAGVALTLQWTAAADRDAQVAALAVEGLGRLGRRPDDAGAGAVRALVALTAEAPRREQAIAALSELPGARIHDIAAGLRHPSPDVRRATVEALGRVKQPAATGALETALDDPDASVRLAAVRELRHLGSRGAGRRLVTMARMDPDAGVRRAAMLAAAGRDEGGGSEGD